MMSAPTTPAPGLFGLESCAAAVFPMNPYAGESLTVEQGLERDAGLCLATLAADPTISHLSQGWGGFEIHGFRTANGLYAVVTLAEKAAIAPPDPD